jgi:NAD+ synthase
MRELQARIIEEMGVQPRIDPAGEVRKRVTFLKEYLKATHTKGFVLGISGGLDSSLAGKLAQLAVEELEARGWTRTSWPCACRTASSTTRKTPRQPWTSSGPRRNGRSTFQRPWTASRTSSKRPSATEISDFHKGNTKARTRMIAQYALAGEHNYLVIGTDHGAESVTGFFTKYGDGGADILPLFGLNKRQNRALLEQLGAPARVWEKVPTADLLDDRPGRTDEDELGLSYDQIDDYLEGRDVSDSVRRPDRGEVPADPAQAHRPGQYLRHLVEGHRVRRRPG